MPRRERAALLHKYKIFETNRFSADLRTIARSNRAAIEEKLLEYVYPQLKEEPHFGPNVKKLRNWKPDTWRYRISDWRFFYIIDEEYRVVNMISAAHRKNAYR